MSLVKSATLPGAILALLAGQGADAHGTGQHDAATIAGSTASPRQSETQVPVTVPVTAIVTVNPDAAVAQVVQVTRGAHVHLSVFGVGAKALHLHGYDIEMTGEVDQPALIVFDATASGRFPLEMHVEDDLLGKGEKAVLYIEVREP